MLVLDDSKLRLKAKSLTQLAHNDREKALAIYAYVKRMPHSRPVKLQTRTARQVIEAGHGDSEDKATLFIALLRACSLPARLRYVEIHGSMLRGLSDKLKSAARPLVEVYLPEPLMDLARTQPGMRASHWVCTDTYIFDASYVAAASAELDAQGWTYGFGLHRDAQQLWDGLCSSYLGGLPTEHDPMVLEDLGLFHDAREYSQSMGYKRHHKPLARFLEWGVFAPQMSRTIQLLRQREGFANSQRGFCASTDPGPSLLGLVSLSAASSSSADGLDDRASRTRGGTLQDRVQVQLASISERPRVRDSLARDNAASRASAADAGLPSEFAPTEWSDDHMEERLRQLIRGAGDGNEPA